MPKKEQLVEVTATPNPVAANNVYTLDACGLEMRPVEVFINDQFAYAVGVRSTTEGGCLDNNEPLAPEQPGSYQLTLYQPREHGKKKDLVGETTLQVT